MLLNRAASVLLGDSHGMFKFFPIYHEHLSWTLTAVCKNPIDFDDLGKKKDLPGSSQDDQA